MKNLIYFWKYCLLISYFFNNICAHFCGNNRIPYGIEVYRNGQPALLCSRPSCFEKTYAECDERAQRKSCDSNSSWVGGFDKGYGNYQPLYVQCCEFEGLEEYTEPLYSKVIIRAGEYFEGEEIMDETGQEMIAFDLITNLKMLKTKENSTNLFEIDIRRFNCNRMIRPKKYHPWKWP